MASASYSVFNERGWRHAIEQAVESIALERLTETFWNLVELIGIEPTTSGLQSQRSPN
jgi:hypothetical protein